MTAAAIVPAQCPNFSPACIDLHTEPALFDLEKVGS